MGIQTLVVFVGLALALVIGVLAGAMEVGPGLTGWLVVALVPTIWALVYVTERLIGRELWHYTAPYPYRWMEVPAKGDGSRPHAASDTARDRDVTGLGPEQTR